MLIGLKLGAGLASGSLGLISSRSTRGRISSRRSSFFAVGVAGRPADPGHPYGHGKAEHLAAVAEASILVLASLFISYKAIEHLVGSAEREVDAAWYTFLVIGVVIAVDASRTLVSWRASRRYGSAALEANALHFGGDLAGSVAVLIGLALVAGGYGKADSLAALFVAVLVLIAAARLIRSNIDVLMDTTPDEAHEAAREAIAGVDPPVELRRLRLRSSAGRHFADVVIGVPPGAAVGQGTPLPIVSSARCRTRCRKATSSSTSSPARRRRCASASWPPRSVSRVREVHNLRVVTVNGGVEVGLHLKLPGELPLSEAHEVASQVERAIAQSVPAVVSVQTHLEPLREPGPGERLAVADQRTVAGIVRELTGEPPREVRFIETEDGVLLFVTVRIVGGSLAEAHERASEIEERIRAELPEVADVVVHTEP